MLRFICANGAAVLRERLGVDDGSPRPTCRKSWATASILVSSHGTDRLSIHIRFQYHVLRQMIENSWAWAKARNLLRVNEVHKCEEAKLILEETFATEIEHGERMELDAITGLEENHAK